MDNRTKPKTSDEPESSAKKDNLIKALIKLSNDFPWLKGLIDTIKKAPLIENDFEILGLARKIAYTLLEKNPKLFDDNDKKTHQLKDLINQLVKNITVLKNHKESLDKIIENTYNEALKKAQTKPKSKR